MPGASASKSVRPASTPASADFIVEDNAIRYALGALKGVGERAMNDWRWRAAAGRFTSLDDLPRRIDPRCSIKQALESLAAAGAFDEIEPDRAVAFAAMEPALAAAARAAQEKAAGQNALFGESDGPP